MKFDAYIEERVVRMAFELKMLLVIERWHLKRVRMALPMQVRKMYYLMPRIYSNWPLSMATRRGFGNISCAADWVNESMLIWNLRSPYNLRYGMGEFN